MDNNTINNREVIQEYHNDKIHSITSENSNKIFCDGKEITEYKTIDKESELNLQNNVFYESILAEKPSNIDTVYDGYILGKIKINEKEESYMIRLTFMVKDREIISIEGEIAVNIPDKKTKIGKIEINECIFSKEERIFCEQKCIKLTGKITLIVKVPICPYCGEEIINPTILLNNNYTLKEIGQYLFYNPENIKYSDIYKMVFNRNGKMHCMQFKNLTIFNKTSYKIYYIGHRFICGSPYLKNVFKQKICDITFKCENAGNNNIDFFCKRILDYYKSLDELSYFYLEKDIEVLMKNNLIWNKTKQTIEIAYVKRKYGLKNNFLIYILLKLKMQNNDILKSIEGLTDKEIMKKFFINNKLLSDCKFLYNIQTSKYLYFLPYLKNVNDTKQFANERDYGRFYETDKRNNFLYQYGKRNNRVKFLNELIKNDNYILADSNGMYRKIRKEIKNYKIDWNNSIKYLHDLLLKDYNRMKHKNKELPIDEDLQKIIDSFDDFPIKYHLASDTDELVKTGSFMDICVGSYREEALSKESLIVIGCNKIDEPVTCIELKKFNNKFNLIQVKKAHNDYAEDKENDYLVEQFTKNKVNLKTTWDLRQERRIKEVLIDGNNVNANY